MSDANIFYVCIPRHCDRLKILLLFVLFAQFLPVFLICEIQYIFTSIHFIPVTLAITRFGCIKDSRILV